MTSKGKYRIGATVTLSSQVEPDGYISGIEYEEGVSDWEESSYFSAEGVTVEGGEFSFTIEADSEEDARREAQDLLDNSLGFDSRDNFEWEVQDADIVSVEELEAPVSEPTVAEAVESFLRLVQSLVTEGKMSDEAYVAIRVLLHQIQGLLEKAEATV